MQKTILKKFIQVLSAALLLNSVIFYIACSTVLQETSAENMLLTLRTVDSLLDYQKELDNLLSQMNSMSEENGSRITVIRTDGTVQLDSSRQDVETMENHLRRPEVEEALRSGFGFASRRSDTLDQYMLYAAYYSEKGQVILRLSAPYSGLREFLPMLLPAAWLSFAAALLASFLTTGHFVATVTRPLREIASEMEKLNGNGELFHFEPCEYPEINIIGSTTLAMSSNVRESLKQLDNQRKIREEFFSNASHELKTPITSIQGYAELLENGIIKDEAMRQDFIKRIHKEASRMTSLINDILMISRLESREARLTYGEVNLAEVVRETVEGLKPLTAQKQVYIHQDCQKAVIWADEKQMKELIGNLIGNAVKYNRQGGQVWIGIREEKEESRIRIEVKDNGVGIPKGSLPRIFERFYRVEKGRSKKEGGTGLGLSIVKHIVTYYKGTIEVTSQVDFGTQFTVLLPLGKA